MKRVPKEATGGDCYEAAMRTAMDLPPELNPVVVHGYATGQGPVEGWRFHHAWVEVGEALVFDYSNGGQHVLPRARYYEVGQIEVVRRYPLVDALVTMTRRGHYGPWHRVRKPHPAKTLQSARGGLQPRAR